MSQDDPKDQTTGISNRESAAEESRERQEHPPLQVGEPPDQPTVAGDIQTSSKEGVRSSAQKQEESRDPERPVPPARKVSGAFGKEPE